MFLDKKKNRTLQYKKTKKYYIVFIDKKKIEEKRAIRTLQ
jgi:hypothetical protein